MATVISYVFLSIFSDLFSSVTLVRDDSGKRGEERERRRATIGIYVAGALQCMYNGRFRCGQHNSLPFRHTHVFRNFQLDNIHVAATIVTKSELCIHVIVLIYSCTQSLNFIHQLAAAHRLGISHIDCGNAEEFASL